MPNSVKILVIGDIVGRGGRTKIIKNLSKIREKYQADFIVANGENATNEISNSSRVLNKDS